MAIFITGLAMFVGGIALNAVGWAVHRRSVMSGDTTVRWFADVLKHWFPKLTGQDATGGERLAAAGAIISALGLVVAVIGATAWGAG